MKVRGLSLRVDIDVFVEEGMIFRVLLYFVLLVLFGIGTAEARLIDQWNLLQKAPLGISEPQVVDFVFQGGRLYALISSQNPKASESKLVSSDIHGRNVQAVQLLFGHVRSLAKRPDGTLLFLSVDAIAQKQKAVRISPSGSIRWTAEVRPFARSIWQQGASLRVSVGNGEVWKSDARGAWTKEVEALSTGTADGHAARCGSCEAPVRVHGLPRGDFFLVDPENGAFWL
jgi:hypothetical protein